MKTYLPDDFRKRYPLISRFSAYYRQRRVEKFIHWMGIQEETTILDVGGMPYYWQEFPVKAQVTCLNLYRQDSRGMDTIRQEVYDGEAFPFADQSFDVVHSNSVLEHVGDEQAQRRFAAEIQRVGKRYWVQTPNFFMPFEPHAQFPGYQFLPKKIKAYIAKRWKKVGYPPQELLAIKLLTRSRLARLFPEGRIWRERFLLWTKSFCVYSNPGKGAEAGIERIS